MQCLHSCHIVLTQAVAYLRFWFGEDIISIGALFSPPLPLPFLPPLKVGPVNTAKKPHDLVSEQKRTALIATTFVNFLKEKIKLISLQLFS